VAQGADMAEASPARKLVAGGTPGELVATAAVLWLNVLREGKKEMEGERWEAAVPDIGEGGHWLTGLEEDGGFGSLSGCDLDDDGLWGARREVSAVAGGVVKGGGMVTLPAEGRSTTRRQRWRGAVEHGTVGFGHRGFKHRAVRMVPLWHRRNGSAALGSQS
jgi:hypothetical protein